MKSMLLPSGMPDGFRLHRVDSHRVPLLSKISTWLLMACLGLMLFCSSMAQADQVAEWLTGTGPKLKMRVIGTDEVKGIVIWGNTYGDNASKFADNAELIQFAKTMGFAIIATSYWGNMHSSSEMAEFERGLDYYATLWNRPEIRHVPWLPMGWSNGGNMSFGFNIHRPQKVIAFSAFKGGNYSTSTQSAASRKTPGFLIYGRSDTSRIQSTWDCFNNNRPQGALWAILAESTGHTEGGMRGILFPFFYECYRLRYPHGQSFRDGPVALRDVNEADGWLADQNNWGTGYTPIYRYDQAPMDPLQLSWLPSRRMAYLCRSWTSFNRIAFTTSGSSGSTTPATLTYSVSLPDGAWNLAEFYEGDTKMAEATPAGGNTPSFSMTVASKGVYFRHAIVTKTDGSKSVVGHRKADVTGAEAPPLLEVMRGYETIAAGGVDGVSGTTAATARQLAYKLTNIGTLPLILAPPVTISGQSNCAVVINTQPSGSEIREMYNTSMALTVTPAAGGLWSFKVAVPHADPLLGTREWTVTGVATGGTSTATLTAVEDTYISNISTGTNYGTETSIRLNNKTSGGGASVLRGLLRFDLSSIPSTSTVTSASLLFVQDNNVSTSVNIAEATGTWSEATATWANSSGLFGSTSLGSATTGSTAGAAVPAVTLNTDGLTKVQSWVSNPTTNKGFGITTGYAGNNAYLALRSREYGTETHRPRLSIGYSSPSAVPLMVVTRNSGFIPQGGSSTITGSEAGLATQADYQIQNLGGADISASNVTFSALSNCSVALQSSASFTVSPLGASTLTLAVTPAGSGAWSAVVTVVNNDPAKSPYSWTITGSALPRYTVTLDPQGGSGGSTSVRAAFGDPMPSAAAPTRPGYDFNGYYELANGGGKQYYGSSMESVRNWDVNAPATLYAKWTLLPPVAPSDVVATLNGDRVDLAWTLGIETTSTVIMRSVQSGGPYTEVGTTTGTTFLDTTVAQGTRYFYVLFATNAAGASEESEEVTMQTPVRLPFAENFESLLPDNLHWQNNWDALGAEVQGDLVHSGSKAARMHESQGYMRRGFGGAETKVWTDLYVIPVFAAEPTGHLYPDTSALVYFNQNGNPVAYNGQTPQVISQVTLTAGQWVRVTVYTDHAARTWDLYINGVKQAEGLAFASNAQAVYKGMRVEGAGDSVVYLDDVRIGMVSPFAGVSPSMITARGPISFAYNGSGQGPAGAVVVGSPTRAVTFSYRGTGTTSYGPSANKPVDAGSYEVVATVAADDNFAAATSAPYAFRISPALAGAPVAPASEAAVSSVESPVVSAESAVEWAVASGGQTSRYRDANGVQWIIHAFTQSGTNNFTITSPGRLEYLVVGGGGAGGKTRGGGGGAGGVLTGEVDVVTGSLPVTVGEGGLGGSGTGIGGDSGFGGIIAKGGGNGGRHVVTADASIGGSGGGGGGYFNMTGAAGASGQGYQGGNGSGTAGAGGGGGAGGAGTSTSTSTAGKGGNGIQSVITGVLSWYGGGGGGMGTSSAGGLGGGGAGTSGTTGTATSGAVNTGGGGGGGGDNGGNGGSGIVVVRYQVEWARVEGGVTSLLQDETGQYWKLHKFTNVGSSQIQVTSAGAIEYLVVGGGGAGGRVRGGGGGAGGMLAGMTKMAAGTVPVTVGAGGLGGSGTGVGGNSSLGSVVANGGGNGGRHPVTATPGSGGSGGGGGGYSGTTGGAGIAGQGNAGGNSTGSADQGGAGGGGAGKAAASISGSTGSAGGDGLQSAITGTLTWYAGGGGGMSNSYTSNIPGGLGGGGRGAKSLSGTSSYATSGEPNTGGGGGGAGNVTNVNGGNGGSGVVILRYPIERPTMIIVE